VRWQVHRAIGRALSAYLDLSTNLEEALLQGLVRPDVIRNSYPYHHRLNPSIVMKHVWNARALFLRGALIEAMKSLGEALHYVQDMCISEGFLSPDHDSAEMSLWRISGEAIRDGLRRSICSPSYIYRCLTELKPGDNPEEIMRKACFYSATIAGAVLGPVRPPDGLMAKLKEAGERYHRRTIPASVSLFLISAVLTFILPLFVIGMIISLIIPFLDEYRDLRREAAWFKLDQDL